MTDTIVTRTVDLAASADDVWRLLTDADELGAWLGGRVELPIVAGAAGAFVEHDGAVRRVAVDLVDTGRAVGFTWWADGDEGTASTVRLTIEEADGATRLTVVEQPVVALAGGRSCQASLTIDSTGDRWDDRLMGLELGVLTLRSLVLA